MEFDKNFKENFRISGFMPPTLFVSPIDGRKFAVSGSTWIHVPDDMTYADICKGYIKTGGEKLVTSQKDFEKEVLSSKGVKKYKVAFKGGSWHCTCSGFGFRRKCAHVEATKKELKMLF